MRVRRPFLVGCMVIALAGVWLDAQTTPAGYPAFGAPPVISLQSTGVEPRRPLRYALTKGREESMALDTTMGMSMSMAGMAMPDMVMPTMHMVGKSTVTDVAPNGDASTQMSFSDVSLINGAGVDPALSSALQSGLADLKTMPSTATMTSRGIMRDSKFDLTKITNPQMAQMMGSMASTMQSLSVPFPEEPVGVGAKWTVRQALPSNGLNIYQEFQLELQSIDEHGCKLAFRMTQTAPPQPVQSGLMPAGVQATLDRFEGAGTGTKTIQFDSLIPTSDMSMKTTTAMSVDAGGSSQQIAVTVTLKATVAPVK